MKSKLSYPRKDLKGKRFGKLLVESFSHYEEYKQGHRRPIWNCICDCGTQKLIIAGQLTAGQISCGCALEEYRQWAKTNFKPLNMKPVGQAAKLRLFADYMTRAKKKEFVFELTLEQFSVLTQTNCYYCGITPQQSVVGKRKKRFNGDYQYNGLDRIDNTQGYILENTIPCCGICNKAKRDLPLDIFLDWIERLSKYASKIDFHYGIKNRK